MKFECFWLRRTPSQSYGAEPGKPLTTDNEKYEAMVIRNEVMRSEVTDLTKQVNSLKVSYAEASSDLEQRTRELAEAQRNASNYSEHLRSVTEEKILALTTELSVLTEQLSAANTENKKMTDDMRLMYKKHRQERQELEEKYQTEDYKARYGRALKENQVLTEALNKSMELLGEAEAVDDLQAAITAQLIQKADTKLAEANSAELAQQVAELTTQLEAFAETQRQLAELQTQHSDLEAQLVDAQTALQRANDQSSQAAAETSETMSEQLAGLQEQIQTYQKGKEEAEQKLEVHMFELEEATVLAGEAEALQEQLAAVQAEKSELQAKVR